MAVASAGKAAVVMRDNGNALGDISAVLQIGLILLRR